MKHSFIKVCKIGDNIRKTKNIEKQQTWWYTPIILVYGRWRQDNLRV